LSGICPELRLKEQEKKDLVAFMRVLQVPGLDGGHERATIKKETSSENNHQARRYADL
jgi:hypothetical protein